MNKNIPLVEEQANVDSLLDIYDIVSMGGPFPSVDDGCDGMCPVNKSILDETKRIAEEEGYAFDDSVYSVIDASHSGYVNDNYRMYVDDALRDVARQLNVKRLPFMKLHDMERDPIGTILYAEWFPLEKEDYADSPIRPEAFEDHPNLPSGVLKIGVVVNDEEAAKQFKRKLYNYVSIGGKAKRVSCSVCGKDIDEHQSPWGGLFGGDSEDEEEKPQFHFRGEKYDGKTCYWKYESMDIVEVSAVPVGADVFNMINVVSDELKNIRQISSFGDIIAKSNTEGVKKMALDEKQMMKLIEETLLTKVSGLIDTKLGEIQSSFEKTVSDMGTQTGEASEKDAKNSKSENATDEAKVERGLLKRKVSYFSKQNKVLAKLLSDSNKKNEDLHTESEELKKRIVDLISLLDTNDTLKDVDITDTSKAYEEVSNSYDTIVDSFKSNSVGKMEEDDKGEYEDSKTQEVADPEIEDIAKEEDKKAEEKVETKDKKKDEKKDEKKTESAAEAASDDIFSVFGV